MPILENFLKAIKDFFGFGEIPVPKITDDWPEPTPEIETAPEPVSSPAVSPTPRKRHSKIDHLESLSSTPVHVEIFDFKLGRQKQTS
ncbi:hypothetical protein AGMMS50276_28450 [Synergistales bacterium]|nr:hypothetical protein AGMMS50276_28450 [Synergistales bacterium]